MPKYIKKCISSIKTNKDKLQNISIWLLKIRRCNKQKKTSEVYEKGRNGVKKCVYKTTENYNRKKTPMKNI